MEPNAPKDPLDPKYSPPSSPSDIPPVPQPPSEPFAPPAPPAPSEPYAPPASPEPYAPPASPEPYAPPAPPDPYAPPAREPFAPPVPQSPSEPFIPPPPPAPVSNPAPLGGNIGPALSDVPPGALPSPPPGTSPFAEGPVGELPPLPPSIPSTKDERLWATLIHISGVVGLFGFAGMSFGLPIPANILLPLILWLVKREGNPFVDQQGKEALNFQITVFLISLVCIPLAFVCIGIPMLIAVAIASMVLGVIAAIKANEGVAYRYPFAWRLIS